MRDTAFIICEYNPFHNGHLLHIEKTREAGAKRIVCVMSGNFVQRGEIAFCDKTVRAGFAVEHGADLVLELPVKYVLSGAGYFAKGALETVYKTQMRGTLSFGASCDTEQLQKMAYVSQLHEVTEAVAKESLASGATYAAALQKTLRELYPDVAEAFGDPNNILAAEYIKAAEKMHADVDCFAVARSLPHDAEQADGKIASAKCIRDSVYDTKDIASIQNVVPDKVFKRLETESRIGALPADKTKFSVAAMARLVTLQPADYLAVNGVNQGLENRIADRLRNCSDLYALFDAVKTKRYTHARIRQILLSAVLGIKKTALEREQPYLRVLGMNETGKGIIKEIRGSTSVPVIMNLSEAPECEEKDLDALCGKLFDLCRPCPQHKAPEYAAKPYVS